MVSTTSKKCKIRCRIRRDFTNETYSSDNMISTFQKPLKVQICFHLIKSIRYMFYGYKKICYRIYCPKAIRWPPCTKINCPVTQLACSEARNTTVLAISSGRPTRRNGISVIRASSISGEI